MSTYRLSSDATGRAGTISEESISTIRTAKAFSTQSHIGVLFNEEVLSASRADIGLAIVLGLGLAAMFFISYAAYGLGER
jgi:ATP-binding cassette subfamily B (MDR/TAP) protein 1